VQNMELILEPGQTIKFDIETNSTVQFYPAAFGQHCFVASNSQEIKNQTYLACCSTTIHAFNASYETMLLTIKNGAV